MTTQRLPSLSGEADAPKDEGRKQRAGGAKRRSSRGWIVLTAVLSCSRGTMVQPFDQMPAPDDEAPPPTEAAEPSLEVSDLLDLDIEQLSRVDVVVPSFDVEVTSVTRSESTVGRSAAAVFVITPEMIRRSGATSLPELLRMVPGMYVARITANTWAVSSRGFAGQFSNKLLVLIDGRSVYSPFFSGVHWDSHDLVLQDIDRIEVIRGPGGTLWGANAVNGVINIITKSAADTQGTLISSGGGSEDRSINAVRYGDQIGSDFHYRVFGKHFERDDAYAPGGAHDDWRQMRAGFRGDWKPFGSDSDVVTFQGDLYDGDTGQEESTIPLTQAFTLFFFPTNWRVHGGDLLARWTHTCSDEGSFTLQTYYDHWGREGPDIRQHFNIFDLELTSRTPIAEDHELSWGLGYRLVRDKFVPSNPDNFVVEPARRQTNLYSAFVQDEITLLDDKLFFTIGSKFEHNDYSGFEYQPSGRLLWVIDERNVAWGSVSRAVRTPSRFEDDFRLLVAVFSPAPLVTFEFLGNRGLEAEDLTAYEMGFRSQPTDRFSWDAAVFFNQYDDLVLFAPGPPFFSGGRFVFPSFTSNDMDGEAYGVEVSGTYQMTPHWKLLAWYSFLQIQLHQNISLFSELDEGTAPHHQAFLMSSWDLPWDLEFDLLGRYVDNVPAVNVPHYISLDLRLGWRPNDRWEISVVGQNLLEQHRLEFPDFPGAIRTTEVDRGVYAQAVFRY